MVMDRIEVITSVERRRHWSATEKARLVAAMNEPGAVVTEIARSAGVVASLPSRWRRQFAAERETTAFVPVRVSPDLNEAVATTAPVCAPSSSVTIAFGAAVCMTIEGAPDSATLAKDAKRRQEAHVPEAVEFRTKPQIALAQIEAAVKAGVAPGIVLTDAGYGSDGAFRAGVTGLGLIYAAGVQSTLSVWPPRRGALAA